MKSWNLLDYKSGAADEEVQSNPDGNPMKDWLFTSRNLVGVREIKGYSSVKVSIVEKLCILCKLLIDFNKMVWYKRDVVMFYCMSVNENESFRGGLYRLCSVYVRRGD